VHESVTAQIFQFDHGVPPTTLPPKDQSRNTRKNAQFGGQQPKPPRKTLT
jgi:hypothetical protein